MSDSTISPSRRTPAAGRPKSPIKRQQTGKDDSQHKGQDLLHGISEKEVEIEHLKTFIVALDEKVKVVESVREDL
jgi:hypothetical protein